MSCSTHTGISLISLISLISSTKPLPPKLNPSWTQHTGRPERTSPQSAVSMTRSQQRPQSAVSTARSLRPQPMSLGVKKKTSSSACERPASAMALQQSCNRAATELQHSACERPASAMARFTSDAQAHSKPTRDSTEPQQSCNRAATELQAHSEPTRDSRSAVVFSADLSPEALAGGGGVRRGDFAPASQVLTMLAYLVVACSIAVADLLQICCSKRASTRGPGAHAACLPSSCMLWCSFIAALLQRKR